MQAEDEEHFNKDRSGKKMFDPSFRSCTGFIAKVAREKFGYEAPDLAELVQWADIIDGAQYPNAKAAVELRAPAMKLTLVIEGAKGSDVVEKIIRWMRRSKLEEIVRQPEIQKLYQPLYERHLRSIEIIRERAECANGVVSFDLIECDLEGIDLKLSDSPTYAVAGAVWDATMEAPCSRCDVRAVRIDGSLMVSHPDTAKTSRQGGFLISGLAPGDYKLIARRGGSDGPVGQRAVVLRSGDLNGVVLPVGLRQPVSSGILLEDPPDGIDAASWVPHLFPLALPDSWPEGRGDVGEGLRFETEALPAAQYRFEVENLPAGAYLKALRVGGQELARPELFVPEETAVSAVQATIAFDGATVSGTVRSGGGQDRPVEARVFLVPGSGRNGYASALTAEADSDGNFRFVSVVPGAYTLYALPGMSSAEIFDPSVQAALRPSARTIDLSPGETATVDLSLAAGW